jgi:hypothetical protein
VDARDQFAEIGCSNANLEDRLSLPRVRQSVFRCADLERDVWEQRLQCADYFDQPYAADLDVR